MCSSRSLSESAKPGVIETLGVGLGELYQVLYYTFSVQGWLYLQKHWCIFKCISVSVYVSLNGSMGSISIHAWNDTSTIVLHQMEMKIE